MCVGVAPKVFDVKHDSLESPLLLVHPVELEPEAEGGARVPDGDHRQREAEEEPHKVHLYEAVEDGAGGGDRWHGHFLYDRHCTGVPGSVLMGMLCAQIERSKVFHQTTFLLFIYSSTNNRRLIRRQVSSHNF